MFTCQRTPRLTFLQATTPWRAKQGESLFPSKTNRGRKHLPADTATTHVPDIITKGHRVARMTCSLITRASKQGPLSDPSRKNQQRRQIKGCEWLYTFCVCCWSSKLNSTIKQPHSEWVPLLTRGRLMLRDMSSNSVLVGAAASRAHEHQLRRVSQMPGEEQKTQMQVPNNGVPTHTHLMHKLYFDCLPKETWRLQTPEILNTCALAESVRHRRYACAGGRMRPELEAELVRAPATGRRQRQHC